MIRCRFLAHGQLPVQHRQMILAIRHRQLLHHEWHIIVRQKCRPSCQRHLGSLHARQCAASRRAYTNTFHILLSFSLAKVHRKTENTIQSYQFSFKIAEDLSFIRLFTAVSQFLVEIHHLAHGGDIPFELPAVEGRALAVHPTEFLEFLAECVVVNPAVLVK